MVQKRQCPSCGSVFPIGENYCTKDGTPLKDVEAVDPLVGQVLENRYRLVRALGKGGMGSVYLAEHVHIQRPFAVKLLHSDLLRDDLSRERFRREALAASRVTHSHIVEVYDFGRTDEGHLYIVMEFLDGEDL